MNATEQKKTLPDYRVEIIEFEICLGTWFCHRKRNFSDPEEKK